MKKEKLCVLYACKAHLSVILLEHILHNKKYEVITFLQDDIKKEINLINDIKNKNEKIKNIKTYDEIKDSKIKKNVIILVEGEDEFLTKSKEAIEEMLEKNKEIENVQIIYCIKYDSKIYKKIMTKQYFVLQTNGKQSIDLNY